MAQMKNLIITICEMFRQKKSIAETIEAVNKEFPGATITERRVVSTLIEHYTELYADWPEDLGD